MILAIDIGNTSSSLGLYQGGNVLTSIHFAPEPGVIAERLREFAAPAGVDGVVAASVAPEGDRHWRESIREIYGIDPLFVDSKCRLGVAIDYPRPERIGADRLANASAAHALYGAPVVVADFGTALTFDVVSARGAYIGGVIAPGLPLMFDYLAERTALLPHVEVAAVDAAVGKSSEEAMQIGARSGYRGMVKGVLGDIRAEVGPCQLCATGGHAEWVLADWEEEIEIVPELTLLGLGGIHDLNQG